MKSIFSSSDAATEQARAAARRRLGGQPANRSVTRGPLRLVKSEQPVAEKLPPWSKSAHIRISEEGRALLAKMAHETEENLIEGSPEDAIALLVAEGIEEGFLD